MILDQVCTRSSHVIDRDLQGEAVLLDLNTGIYFSLNPVGGYIWSLLDGQRTVRDIVDLVVAEYDVDPETAAEDTAALVRDFLEQKLAHTAGEGE